MAVNSMAGQLEYECTHIRDSDVHVKAAGEKRDTRGTVVSKGREVQKVKERSEETLRAEYCVDSSHIASFARNAHPYK